MVRQRPSNYKKPVRPKRGRKNRQQWRQAKAKYRRKLRKWQGPKNCASRPLGGEAFA